MYHYTESGLSNIFLSNGHNVEIIDDEEYTSIDNMNDLHETISIAICTQTKWMSSDQLKFLRKEFNLSQTEFSQKFYCDRQTVARWEKGEIDIPHLVDVILRALYLESIDKENKVSLTIASLSHAEINNMKSMIHLEINTGKWKVIVS
jgi:DNA-binding transcriptional regulator YiaG